MQLSQKQKNFFWICFCIFKFILNFNYFRERGNPQSLRKMWLNKCIKSRLSEDPLTNKMGNGSKYCCNLNESTFTIFINHCERNCVRKSLFQWHNKILRLLFNTLTAVDKHYLLNGENLTQSIQIQLSLKQKTFSEFVFEFWKSILNFRDFPKRGDSHSWYFSEIKGSEKRF